jgi:hypothetical protein
MIWAGVAFLIAVSIAMMVARKQLATMQAITFGGNVAPGCVVAEAVVLIVVAVVMLAAYLSGRL